MKNFKLPLCLCLAVLMIGCKEMDSSNIEKDEIYSSKGVDQDKPYDTGFDKDDGDSAFSNANIDKMLSNAKIKDINRYSEIGCVSKKSGSKEQKSKKRNAYKEDYSYSENDCYLAGLIDGEITGLTMDNEKSFWDIPIAEFADLGNFIYFAPNTHNQDLMITYSGRGLLDIGDVHASTTPYYLLSKKTGKIYNITKDDKYERFFESFYATETALYGRYKTFDESNNKYWAVITEENEQLAITKSNMLEFISDLTWYADKYGNILAGGAIYGYNQRELNSNLEGCLPYGYEPYTHTIYTYCNDSFYVLEGLEFKKYDNVIFGYGFEHENPNKYGSWYVYSSNYFYYLDGNGDYKVGYDQKAYYQTDIIYYYPDKDASPEELKAFRKMADLFGDNSNVIKYSYEDYLLFLDNTYGSEWIVYKIINKYTYLNISSSVYQEFSYFQNIVENYAFRNEFIYYVTKKYELMKCDFVNGLNFEIETDGYKIKSMSEDQYGNIVLTGYDSSFNEFTGYLSENDEVVFEPTNKGNAEYDVIYMNPIN